MRAATSRRQNDMVDAAAFVLRLGHQFQKSIAIAEASERIGAANWDEVGLPSLRCQFRHRLLSNRRPVLAGVEKADLRAEGLVEEPVPIRSIDLAPVCHRVGQEKQATRPCRAAAAAVWRAWFDWIAPIVTSISAPLPSASVTRYSSFRALFPPPAKPVQSSRLIQIAGARPLPLRLGERGNGSNGVRQSRQPDLVMLIPYHQAPNFILSAVLPYKLDHAPARAPACLPCIAGAQAPGQHTVGPTRFKPVTCASRTFDLHSLQPQSEIF